MSDELSFAIRSTVEGFRTKPPAPAREKLEAFVMPFMPNDNPAQPTGQIKYRNPIPEFVGKADGFDRKLIEAAADILTAAGRVPFAEAAAAVTFTIELKPSSFT